MTFSGDQCENVLIRRQIYTRDNLTLIGPASGLTFTRQILTNVNVIFWIFLRFVNLENLVSNLNYFFIALNTHDLISKS